MIKFLLIVFLISYLIYKVGTYFFKQVIMSAAQRSFNGQHQNQQQQKRKAPGGNVNIDYIPESKSKKQTSSKGGEYVDYEVVE